MNTRLHNILIADDDFAGRVMLQEGLSYAGFNVQVAENGCVAEQLIQTHDFDLLVLDNQMDPGPTGIELCKKYSDKIPVLIISGADIEQESIAAGAVCFLLRPVTPGHLVSVIRSLA